MTVIATRPLSDSTDSMRFAMRAAATLTGFLGLAGAAGAGPRRR